MKNLSLFLMISFLIFSSNYSIAEDTSKEGKMFVSLALLSSQYKYNLNDTLDELPESFTTLLAGQDIGKDEDGLNVALGIGYYWSDSLSFSVNYVDGVELSSHEFCIIFCSTQGNEFNADMTILEFDAKFRAIDFNQDVSFYILAGAAYHQLDATVIDKDFPTSDPNRVVLEKNITDLGSKLGLGIQWDFLENFGANIGYTQYSFSSVDKFYVEFEYRW